MTDKIIVSTIFVLYGIVSVLKPDWIAKYQIWANKKILGAKFIPSKRTYAFYRGMGLLFLGMAILIVFVE